MREIYRILDASFNRAREALRVIEDCGRFALNDPAVTAVAKTMRSDLREVLEEMPMDEFLTARDTPGDIGTELTSPTEATRGGLGDVARAACKRLGEALRSIEEYAKIVAPQTTVRVERMRYNSYTMERRVLGRLMTGNRLADARLYVLISSHLCRTSVRDVARQAIAGGADVIQIREKDTPDAAFLALAAELRELTDETGKILIVNNRPDIAAMVGADGVHLGQSDLPLAEARRLLRPGAIVGRSTHSLAQAKAALNEGADYIAIGPIFETGTKMAGPPVGVELIAQIAAAVPLPKVAIGGITPERTPELFAAGATCVAVCSALCGADDPRAAAQALRAAAEGSPET